MSKEKLSVCDVERRWDEKTIRAMIGVCISALCEEPVLKTDIARFQRWKNESSVIVLKKLGSFELTSTVTLPDGQEIAVHRCNQALDIRPHIGEGGAVRPVFPVIIIKEDAALSAVLHEIMHVLSIGEYFVQGSCVVHKRGPIVERMKIKEGRLYGTCEQDELLNENQTHLAAEYMMERLGFCSGYIRNGAYEKYLEQLKCCKGDVRRSIVVQYLHDIGGC